MTRSHSCGVDLGDFLLGERRKQRGVVDQNVDLAEPLHGLGDQHFDRTLVADVDRPDWPRNWRRARARSPRQRPCRRTTSAIIKRGALGGERLGIVPADALGAAGQDRNAAVETRHGYFLPFSRRMNFSKPASCCLTMSWVG